MIPSRLRMMEIQLIQATGKSILPLVMVKILELLTKGIGDWGEVLPSVGEGAIACPLMENHPQLKCEIAVSENIANLLLGFRFLHLREDVFEFVYMTRLVALHIADMYGLRCRFRIQPFIELPGTCCTLASIEALKALSSQALICFSS